MVDKLTGVYKKFRYGGTPGYTTQGNLDWNYRGSQGPELTGGVGSDWTTDQWSAFGASGGTVNNEGQLVSGSGDILGTSNYSTVNKQTPGTSGLASIGAIGSAVQGLAGLANAYTGYKNYQLAQDQFESEKAYAGANLYNQGTLVNNQIKNAAEVGQALAGNTMTADQRAAGLAGLANKYVKTAV